ncbi:MAG: DUF421 domain-containing protein [Propionibacteriaceae bacterium]|jgi:uncharacterized membrane protein YcaP (DUF421 family)|nr:DUF421 domain-containing protein [Propionibacteriaceae bacterium]
MDTLWFDLGVSWDQALAVVISGTFLYWFFTLVLKLLGPRFKLRVSTASVAMMMLIGALTARAILGQSPTMLGGAIALLTVMFWEWVLFHTSRWMRGRSFITRDARAVVVDGKVVLDQLAAVGISEGNLYIRLRRAGVSRLDQIKYAIIETDGSLTVMRAGQEVDNELLTDVVLD